MDKSRLLVRKSHILSICLMAVATSIAVTEFILYTPISVESDFDLFEAKEEKEGLEESEESLEAETTAAETEDSEVSEALDPNEITNPSTPAESKPFVNQKELEVKVTQGDTLASILEKIGFNKSEVHLASKALSKVFNLRNLKIGQAIKVQGSRNDTDALVLEGFEFQPDYARRIVVSRSGNGYSAKKVDVPVKKLVRNVSGVIQPRSPEYSFMKCGVKTNLSKEALRALSQVANIRTAKGNVDFELVFSEFYDDKGHAIKRPELMYAAFLIDGKIKRIYRFEDQGAHEYVDSTGTILRSLATNKSMLLHPLSQMKVTSKFGIRKHPISGKVKGHTGVDLSARIGTPVYAAASGVIQRASPYSGYGNYISIKHSKSVNTAYGHLSKIAVHPGQHVSQGQIIGYTGNTGSSTGPHLHYEVIQGGRFVNPLSFVKQEPQKLVGKKLQKFNQFKKQVNLQVVGLGASKSAPQTRKIS